MSLFDTIRVNKPKRNKFNLTHDVKLSTNHGKLTPFFCQEVVPGDTFQVSADVLTRMAPLVSPIMQNLQVYTHFFFVPTRLIWEDFERFITGGKLGDGRDKPEQTPPVAPYLKLASDVTEDEKVKYFKDGSLMDYLGLPSATAEYISFGGAMPISSLPIRAYNKIYNDYYRDENLTDEVEFSIKGGADIIPHMKPTDKPENNPFLIKYRAYRKDYFTSALPTPQRGADVPLPIDVDAEVGLKNTHIASSFLAQYDGTKVSGSATFVNGKLRDGSGDNVVVDNTSNIKVDVNGSASIVELRRALKVQEWLEKNARAGYRYIEQIFSHFGVKSSDARLQRAEYLGGGKSPIMISDVLQTSSTNETTPQGNLAGQGIGVSRVNKFKRFFEEHGYIIGIMSILPRSSYFQGVPRMYLKRSNDEWFWPEFAHLGEQEIKRAELYLSDDIYQSEKMKETFGYAPRYSEYKYIPNGIHGDFRSNPSLQKWHLGRIFNDVPHLNNDFVTCRPESSNQRIFAITDEKVDKYYCLINVNCQAIRPMPKYGTPML